MRRDSEKKKSDRPTLKGDRRASLEKVIGYDTFGCRRTLTFWRRFEDRKAAIEVFVQFEYGRDVTAPVAIVRRRPHRQHRLVEMPLVAFHDQLMSSADQIDAIRLIELGDDIAAEQVAGTALTNAPAQRILGIGPTRTGSSIDSKRSFVRLTRADRTWAHRAVLPSCDRSV